MRGARRNLGGWRTLFEPMDDNLVNLERFDFMINGIMGRPLLEKQVTSKYI
jgi:hypothetical protein